MSTVAYYRYDKDHMPEDDQLITDLRNVVENYNLYVDSLIKNLESTDIENYENECFSRRGNDSWRMFLIQKINSHLSKISSLSQGFSYPDQLIENFYLSLKSKPFVILAGVSGTGKTKLVKLFAESIGATSENGQFTIIPSTT